MGAAPDPAAVAGCPQAPWVAAPPSSTALVLLLALRLAAASATRLARALRAAGAPDRAMAPVTDRDLGQAARQAHALAELGIATVPVYALPAGLADAEPPPVALFVRGDVRLLGWPAVAIVGARRASPAGRRWARERARAAAGAGTLIVSGGAAGIDAAAHAGALAAGGRTLAYLGCAVDRCYPAAHRPLFADILTAGGAVASEHPPGSITHAYDHARRNRLIAAHAHTLTVVEASTASGTLGTARAARRLGRPILLAPALPGATQAGLAWLEQAGGAERLAAPPAPAARGPA